MTNQSRAGMLPKMCLTPRRSSYRQVSPACDLAYLLVEELRYLTVINSPKEPSHEGNKLRFAA